MRQGLPHPGCCCFAKDSSFHTVRYPPPESGPQYLSSWHAMAGMMSTRPVSVATAMAALTDSSWWLTSAKWLSSMSRVTSPARGSAAFRSRASGMVLLCRWE